MPEGLKSVPMKKSPYALILMLILLSAHKAAFAQPPVLASRLLELFDSTTLIKGLSDPWELTYGPDNFLWVTEARGYRVRRVNPNTGASTTVLNLSGMRNFPRYDKINDATDGGKPWPQGGLMGMAIHPQFLSGKPYVYLGYVHTFAGAAATGNGCTANWGGCFFTSRVVRYEYNFGTNQLINPLTLCDTIPGSSDHNSGRMIIAPVSGTPYLFYSVGDMGGGQFDNGSRPINAQVVNKYEGKILRFNLEPDGDAGTYNRWIPNDNPFNGASQSAVWSIGHRNVQGLAYAYMNGLDMLYATEHGPFTDDELNVVERGKNYGHPLVIGMNDNNYNGAAAGASANGAIAGAHNSSAPVITSENANATAIGAANYRAPLKTFYPASSGTVTTIFNNNISGNYDNSAWPSEGIGSIDIYHAGPIPNWSGSIFICTLKGGKIFRLKLNTDGRTFQSLNGADTVSYFRSANRFRDIAFSPDGLSIFVAIDSSQTTSGPTATNPMVSVNRGSIMRFTYNTGGILPTRDPVRPGETRPDFNVTAYPNPATKYLYIMFSGVVHKPVRYQLFDIAGKLVQEEQTSDHNFQVDVAKFRKGVYILKVFNGRGAQVKMQKIIVQ
jgi:PQQ-dependent dehydrogenase (s-GDH family)